MVKQENKLKNSSAESPSRSIAKEMFDQLPAKKREREIRSYFEEAMESLLTDLANLHNEGHERFWSRRKDLWGKWFERESKEGLSELREELRKLWSQQTKISEKDRILMLWLQPSGPSRRPAIIARFEKEAILPNPFNLRALLAFAVVKRATKLSQCHNPDCPTPFFIAKRKDQKYCERGDCTTHAQRQYALDWWRRNHATNKRNRRRKP